MKKKLFPKRKNLRFKSFIRKAYAVFNSMHKVVNIGVVTGCVLMAINTANVFSQNTKGEEQEKILEKELDEVMVSASRIEMPVNQTAKLVTVISKEQIAQTPVQSIQDLLVYIANIDVIQRGGHGVQADISIRGGSFDQTAVLLNGINITNPHTGHYNLDIPINLSDIDRIEILHGPSALVYGSGAFAGGINIITKKNTDEKLIAQVETGMYKLRNTTLRGSAGIGITQNSLSVGSSSSAGYIANSDYNIYNVLWQTRFNFSNSSNVDLQLGYNDKQYGANTFYSAKYPNQYERTSTYMGSAKGNFGSKVKFIPIIYWNRHHDQFDLVKDTDFGRNFHRNDTYGANLILSYLSRLGNTSLGAEYRTESIVSSVLGKPMSTPYGNFSQYDERTNSGIALEHTFSYRKMAASAGVLFNHNTLDDELNLFPSINIAYRPVEHFKIFSSWNKSTRMPTFTDLYYTTVTHDGNADLKSEKSEAVEFGLNYNHQFFSAYATGFLQWGRDIIDWVKIETGDGSKYASWNHTELNTSGIEAGVQFALGKLVPIAGDNSTLKLDYTRMHQTIDTQNYESRFALNYLRDKFTAQFNHTIVGSLSASWFFRYQHRMGNYEKIINLESAGYEAYKPFSTLDVKINYAWNNMNIYMNLNNIYDTYYFDLGNIPQARFWLKGGISYTLK